MDRRALLLRGLATALLGACRGGVDAPAPPVVGDPSSNFHRIYQDEALRARFLLFLRNVFHLFPEDRLHDLVLRSTLAHRSDEEIYRAILAGLDGIRPVGAAVTHALPALRKQKLEMAEQVAALLGEGAVIDGYLEMGTTGRYFQTLGKRITLTGPVVVLNDVAPSHRPADIVERGRLAEVGTFVHLGAYDPVSAEVPDASLDLVSNLIGFHHCPEPALDPFVASLHRVLRPGGRLMLREHDVGDERMDTFVALAHDVFNAGIELSWEENAAQLRHFRSVPAWTTYLEARGFARSPGAELQEGDPTDNTLLVFTRV